MSYKRVIKFSGIEWYVRSGKGNPRQNLWSSDEASVWVDAQGQLHLMCRKIDGKWHAAEVKSVHPVKYGVYRFYLNSRIDLLDENLVAGLFLYKDDSHEIDIEFSRWGSYHKPNSQYAIQPATKPVNIHRFVMNLNGAYSTHQFDWQQHRIRFKSYHGHYSKASHSDLMINEWRYNKKQLIDDGKYHLHINLWLLDSFGPTDKNEAEIIISKIDCPISSL